MKGRAILSPQVVKVKVINLSKTIKLPEYATEGADGLDLRACFDAGLPVIHYYSGGKFTLSAGPEESLVLHPGDRCLIPTGLKVSIPKGYRLHITPRSGLALNSGITVLNTPGKIDSDYRGDIGIILINNGFEPFEIHHNDRIAQCSIERSDTLEWEDVGVLDETDRDSGGFGHTGVK